MLVIVVIQWTIIADQVSQQLRLNRNANRNWCNWVGNQSAIIVEDESDLMSLAITTVADKSAFNSKVHRRSSATEKCHMVLNNE